jgi:type II secretory pathway pseudopilin PulG
MLPRQKPLARFCQSGIAIAPILFLIAILAILAIAISAGSSTFSAGNDQEKARVGATSIISYANAIKQAFDRMRLSGQFPETTISFQHTLPLVSGSTWTGNYDNTNCTNNNCNLFLANNISPNFFQDYVISVPSGYPTNWGIMGASGFSAFQGLNLGTSLNDLFFIVYNLRPDVCAAINRLLSLSDTTNGTLNWVQNNNWSGAVSESIFSVNSGSFTGSDISGKDAFCNYGLNYGSLEGRYYRVLLIR